MTVHVYYTTKESFRSAMMETIYKVDELPKTH